MKSIVQNHISMTKYGVAFYGLHGGTLLFFTLILPKMKTIEFADSVDPGEVAHHEPPHLDLRCLPSSL